MGVVVGLAQGLDGPDAGQGLRMRMGSLEEKAEVILPATPRAAQIHTQACCTHMHMCMHTRVCHTRQAHSQARAPRCSYLHRCACPH